MYLNVLKLCDKGHVLLIVTECATRYVLNKCSDLSWELLIGHVISCYSKMYNFTFDLLFFSMFYTGIEFGLPVPDDSVPISDTKDTSRLVEYSLRCSLDPHSEPAKVSFDLFRILDKARQPQ